MEPLRHLKGVTPGANPTGGAVRFEREKAKSPADRATFPENEKSGPKPAFHVSSAFGQEARRKMRRAKIDPVPKIAINPATAGSGTACQSEEFTTPA